MTQPVVSRNQRIKVPYSKTDKAWVLGIVKHPGHARDGSCIDAEALHEAHKRRLEPNEAKAQRWADRAERVIQEGTEWTPPTTPR